MLKLEQINKIVSWFVLESKKTTDRNIYVPKINDKNYSKYLESFIESLLNFNSRQKRYNDNSYYQFDVVYGREYFMVYIPNEIIGEKNMKSF